MCATESIYNKSGIKITMSENEKQSTGDSVPETEVKESVEAVETKDTTSNKDAKKSPFVKYAISAAVVVVILLGVLYQLEKEGRSSTGVFASVIENQEEGKVVATVNGTEIINSDLDTSIQQFSQAAAVQGVDVTSPDAQVEIRSQALDVLINTALLKQAATEQGMSVTDEEVTERLETIKADIGGEEVLTERMNELGITTERLQQDIKDELLIQGLLDKVFAEANIEVTEEEVATVYEEAGGAEAGLPALEEVREQVELQIRTSKEQSAIDEYLGGLKTEADIEVLNS